MKFKCRCGMEFKTEIEWANHILKMENIDYKNQIRELKISNEKRKL